MSDGGRCQDRPAEADAVVRSVSVGVIAEDVTELFAFKAE